MVFLISFSAAECRAASHASEEEEAGSVIPSMLCSSDWIREENEMEVEDEEQDGQGEEREGASGGGRGRPSFLKSSSSKASSASLSAFPIPVQSSISLMWSPKHFYKGHKCLRVQMRFDRQRRDAERRSRRKDLLLRRRLLSVLTLSFCLSLSISLD